MSSLQGFSEPLTCKNCLLNWWYTGLFKAMSQGIFYSSRIALKNKQKGALTYVTESWETCLTSCSPFSWARVQRLGTKTSYLPTIETEGKSNIFTEELSLRLLSSLGFSSGARWLEGVRKHMETSRVARSRWKIFIPGGLSGTEKVVRLVGQESWQEDVSSSCFRCVSLGWCSDPFPKCSDRAGGPPRLRTGKGN